MSPKTTTSSSSRLYAWEVIDVPLTDLLREAGPIVSAIVALVIALWGAQLRNLMSGPRLTMTIDMQSPDCHPIRRDRDGYYYRMRIGNNGRGRATDVEVRILALRRQVDGVYVGDEDFRPLNLKWSHSTMTVSPGIGAGLDRHCDLCHVWKNDGEEPLVEFDTEVEPSEVRPNVWPTRKPPGDYELDLVVIATEARALHRTLGIQFVKWHDDTNAMFSQGLTIQDRTTVARSGLRRSST